MIVRRSVAFIAFVCAFALAGYTRISASRSSGGCSCDVEPDNGGWFGPCGSDAACDENEDPCSQIYCGEPGHANCGNSDILIDCAPEPF